MRFLFLQFPTSFRFSGKGEVDVYCMCMCFIVSIPFTPRYWSMRHDAWSWCTQGHILRYTTQFDTTCTLRNIGYNVRLGTRRQINDYVKYVRGYQQNVPQHYYFLDTLVLGGYSRKNCVGVYGPRSKTLTPSKNKICDLFYPIYDLTKNSIHLFKTWHLNQYPVSDLL